jgi:hypothetical protein
MQIMTKRVLFVTAVICAIFCCAAFAADITGNWSGTMQMGDQGFTLNYAFKQDGEKLTGSVTGPQGDPLPLKEGKVSGDKISFFVNVDMGGNAAKFTSEGVIKGEEITLTTKAEGMPDFPASAMVLKKAK